MKRQILDLIFEKNDINVTVECILSRMILEKADVNAEGSERLRVALSSLRSK